MDKLVTLFSCLKGSLFFQNFWPALSPGLQRMGNVTTFGTLQTIASFQRGSSCVHFCLPHCLLSLE